jgi:hypothetical protein
MRGVQDLGILENRNVIIDGFFGIIVEPQEWRNFLHNFAPP